MVTIISLKFKCYTYWSLSMPHVLHTRHRYHRALASRYYFLEVAGIHPTLASPWAGCVDRMLIGCMSVDSSDKSGLNTRPL